MEIDMHLQKLPILFTLKLSSSFELRKTIRDQLKKIRQSTMITLLCSKVDNEIYEFAHVFFLSICILITGIKRLCYWRIEYIGLSSFKSSI